MVYIDTMIGVILDPIGDEIIKILLTILMIGIVIFMIGYRYLLNENALIDSGALIIVKKIGDSIEHYSKIFAKLGEERSSKETEDFAIRLFEVNKNFVQTQIINLWKLHQRKVLRD